MFLFWRKSDLLLVRGVNLLICLTTSCVMTRRREFTKPKNARTDFLLSGNLTSLAFCIRLGSAIMKVWLTYHLKNNILLLANSHFMTDIFAPWNANR
jgi:hypothetical protein